MPITGNTLGLYIHVPFCIKKCPYCHFYSTKHTDEKEKAYLNAIISHIAIYKNFLEKSQIISVYFGGGTPSLLKVETIEKILSKLPIKKDIEITLEINPEDIGYDKIKSYKALGINRISIGVQSFDDKILSVLQRRHSSQKAIDVIFDCHNADIQNISIDLMYDIMHQDLSSWKANFEKIKDLPITHLSLYNLIFEKNTPFYRKIEKLNAFLPDEKTSLAFLNYALKFLKNLDFKRYEISAFAKKGFNSIHNSIYWEGKHFLGFGPSAFSYLDGKRFKNFSSLEKYVLEIQKGNFIEFEEKLSYPSNINELLVINLRLIKGVNIKSFEKKFGKIPLKNLEILKNSIFVKFTKNKISLNKKGLLFYDYLAQEII